MKVFVFDLLAYGEQLDHLTAMIRREMLNDHESRTALRRHRREKTAQRFAPIGCCRRGFLVEDRLNSFLVHQRDPLIAVLFPETLQDRPPHLLGAFGQPIAEGTRLIVRD